VWLNPDPELMQESVVESHKRCAQGGFEIDEDFRDLPAHVALELEFLCPEPSHGRSRSGR